MQDRFLKQHEFKLNEYTCGGECALHPGESCPVVVPPADLPFLGGTAVDMNWSGPVCLPWCGHGKRSGMADMSIESFNVYKSCLRMQDYHVKAVENAPGFPFSSWLADTTPDDCAFKGKKTNFGPTDIGWPVLRHRLQGIAYSDPFFAWCGPDAETVTADFLSIFGSVVGMDAPSLQGLDSKEHRLQCYADLAKYRGIRGFEELGDLAIFLPVCKKKHYKMYQKLAVDGPICVDLSTNPTARPGRSGKVFPTITRSTQLAKVSRGGR